MTASGTGQFLPLRGRRNRALAVVLVVVGFVLGVTGPFLYSICTTTTPLGVCAEHGYRLPGLGLVTLGALLLAFGLIRLVTGVHRTGGQ